MRAFTCWEDIICQLWSRIVWVSRKTSRHEFWMDDGAFTAMGRGEGFGGGRMVANRSLILYMLKLRRQASDLVDMSDSVRILIEISRVELKISEICTLRCCDIRGC